MEVMIAMTTDEKRCEYCGSLKTNIVINEEGTKYQKWMSNPYKEGTWICWKCCRNYLYLKAHPPNYFCRREHKGGRK
jgi:hypothetical protein